MVPLYLTHYSYECIHTVSFYGVRRCVFNAYRAGITVFTDSDIAVESSDDDQTKGYILGTRWRLWSEQPCPGVPKGRARSSSLWKLGGVFMEPVGQLELGQGRAEDARPNAGLNVSGTACIVLRKDTWSASRVA